MGDELGKADTPSPAPAAAPPLLLIDENSRGLLLRRITEEGGFAFVNSAELAAAGDLRSAEAAREMAWEQLHSGPWDEVVPTWRDAYALACLFVADIRASAGDLKEAMRVLDMGLIMGGPFLRRELEAAVGKIAVMSASKEVECFGRSNGWGSESCRSWSLDEVLQILPSRSLTCKVVEKHHSPSLEAFVRDYFLRSYPVIISNYIDHWPARTKWKDVDYLKSIAGSRTVPVEVGKNYLSSDWKQELITFSQFLDRIHSNIGPANLTYLAQHPLFDQIQELRNDIMIPDYCYAGGGELQSLNAWFGPPGTVTPLHHDPHHNIFAQIKLGSASVILHWIEAPFGSCCAGLQCREEVLGANLSRRRRAPKSRYSAFAGRAKGRKRGETELPNGAACFDAGTRKRNGEKSSSQTGPESSPSPALFGSL